jgi:hypothetical protein
MKIMNRLEASVLNLKSTLPGGVFQCLDLRTGELLWEKSGSIPLGHNLLAPSQIGVEDYAGAAPTPYLWGISTSTWKKFDPLTGNLAASITNALPPTSLNLYFGSN